MTNLAVEQLFELGVLLITAIVYIIAHYLCYGLALLISGQKSGVIRGFIQGFLLVGLFAVSVIFFFNGRLKAYQIITYIFVVFAIVRIIELIKNRFNRNKTKANIADKDNKKVAEK